MRIRVLGTARKVEQETCRESRSRKLDFREAHSLFPSLSCILSLSANRLVCNSREDGPQFSGRARLVVRFSIISPDDVALYRARVPTYCFVCNGVRGNVYTGFQRDLRRMKVSENGCRTAPHPWRNDISRRKFERWRMSLQRADYCGIFHDTCMRVCAYEMLE